MKKIVSTQQGRAHRLAPMGKDSVPRLPCVVDASHRRFRLLTSLFSLLSLLFDLRSSNFELRPRIPHSELTVHAAPPNDTPRKKRCETNPFHVHALQKPACPHTRAIATISARTAQAGAEVSVVAHRVTSYRPLGDSSARQDSSQRPFTVSATTPSGENAASWFDRLGLGSAAPTIRWGGFQVRGRRLAGGRRFRSGWLV